MEEQRVSMEEERGGRADDGGRSSMEVNNGSVKQQDANNDTMKFSFTALKPKFSASRPPLFPKGKQRRDGDHKEMEDVEFVTAFDEEHGMVGKGSRGLRAERVIPKLENSWRPEKRMKNIMMETDFTTGTDERFQKEEDEMMVGGVEKPVPRYGLTLGVKKVEEGTTTTVKEENGHMNFEEERTEKYLTVGQVETQRLRQDLTNLPDAPDMDAYEEMPVEDFGEALLRGMGWETGNPIGRNSKVAVVPVEYLRRVGRTGLGAEPIAKNNNNTRQRQIKPGESRAPKPDLVASVGPDGRVRNVVSLDEKLVERSRKGVIEGKVMSIISGRHLGLRGEVLDAANSDRVPMKLVKSGEKVFVSAKDLADIGSLEEEKMLKQVRQLRIGNGEDSRRDHMKEDYDSRVDAQENPADRRRGRKEEGRREKEESRDGRREKEESREGRREKDGRRDERADHGSKGGHRYDDEELNSRSWRDNRKDGRESEEKFSRSGRRERKRDDSEDMDIDDGRVRRTEDGGSLGDQKREERRDDNRRDYNRREERREEEQGRTYEKREERGPESDRQYSKPWLISQIRVRVISKTLKEGKLYLKKARIIDVGTPRECDILLDESGEVLQRVRQDQLETALPKRGGRVLVVGGKYRGLLGKLIERDSEEEVGLVQLEESFEMTNLSLDLLAEFVGDVNERDH